MQAAINKYDVECDFKLIQTNFTKKTLFIWNETLTNIEKEEEITIVEFTLYSRKNYEIDSFQIKIGDEQIGFNKEGDTSLTLGSNITNILGLDNSIHSYIELFDLEELLKEFSKNDE